MRAIIDGSQVISPPARMTRTSESPSSRCDLIDIVRPLAKYTSSACAGSAQSRTAAATRLVRIHKRMEHSDSKLPRIFIVAELEQRRNKRLIDHEVQLDHVV